MKIRLRSISILYLYYICFLFNIFFNKGWFRLLYVSIAILFTVVNCILSNRIRALFRIELILIMMYLTFSFFTESSGKDLIFLLICYFFSLYFYANDFNENEVINFINYTFVLYLFLSILLCFGYIDISHIYGRNALNQFDITFFGHSFKTFVGIEGSTSDIDSYGFLVAIINLLLNKRKSRKIYILIGTISSLMSFRLTPIVAVIGIFVYKLVGDFRRKKIIFGISSLLCFSSFSIPYLLEGFNFSQITHDRSITWINYINMIRVLPKKDIIFGYRQTFPEVYVEWANGYITNPHSSYLAILINLGIIIFFIYFLYITYRFYYLKNEKLLCIALFVFITAITNSGVFDQYIPSFFIVIYWLLNYERINNKNNIYGGQNVAIKR